MSEINKKKRIAIALLAAELQHQLDENYLTALRNIVFHSDNTSPKTDRKELLAAEKRLKSRASRNLLTLVWCSSPEVAEAALEHTHYPKLDIGTPLTCNSLANLISKGSAPKDSNASNRLIRATTRIIQAASAYGLIKFEGGTPNNKPFQSTPLLENLMVSANLKNAKDLNDFWSLNDNSLDQPYKKRH